MGDREEDRTAVALACELKAPERADKQALRAILRAQDAVPGSASGEVATAEMARRTMLDDGVRPEENVFSRDILRAREA